MFPYLSWSPEGTWDSHPPVNVTFVSGSLSPGEFCTPLPHFWLLLFLLPSLPLLRNHLLLSAWRTTSLPMGTGPSDAFSKGAFHKQRRSLFPAECLPPGPLACFHLPAFVAHLFWAVPCVQGFNIFFLSSQPFHQVSGIIPGLKTRKQQLCGLQTSFGLG